MLNKNIFFSFVEFEERQMHRSKYKRIQESIRNSRNTNNTTKKLQINLLLKRNMKK